MGAGSDELSIALKIQQRHGWLLVPVEIGRFVTIDMVLDTGSARSAISMPMFDMLDSQGRLDALGGERYALKMLRVQGQEMPDLAVYVRRRVTQVGANGLIGLDFLGQYREIHFTRSTMTLSLRGRSSS